MPDFLKKMVSNQRMGSGNEIEGEEKVSTNDQLLFHPCEDELTQQWVKDRVTNGGGHADDGEMCVSCSQCFTAISYSAKESVKDRHVYEAT